MEIKALAATFGRLSNESLTFSPGMNVIEAANESGKSTWMAFLRVMLYGLNTRDRSPGADKRRYFPWSGSAMQGRADLIANGESITLSRTTARANSPMGAFSACYTGTSTPVDDLTSANCGETLLGIPLEVFERSAFIRQSGIPFNQNATLERRIASLITTGEEDSSYTDASDRLRKQLNRRRHNKTGLLPQLENEIRALEGTLSEISSLESSLRSHEDSLDALTKKDSYLRHQLLLIEAAECAQRAAQIRTAQDELAQAERDHHAASERAARFPSGEEISSISAALDALDSLYQSAQAGRIHAERCAEQLSEAERQLSAHPFYPQTPEEVSNTPVINTPRPRLPGWALPAAVLGCAVLIPLLHFTAALSLPLSLGITLLLCGLILLTSGLLIKRRLAAWETEAAEKRLAHTAEAEIYAVLYEAAQKERTACHIARETYRALDADYHLRLSQALSRVQRFAVCEDVAAARKAIQTALEHHADLARSARNLHTARTRWEVLSENAPDISSAPSEPPALSRSQAENELQFVTGQLSQLRREIHTTQGRIQALGDRTALFGELTQLQEHHAILQKEYNAIELASQTLAAANTTLQSRFSPALGEKSASIFTKLTKGKYNKVLLDRDMTPSAQETGDILSHEAFLLSQGTADQLYLAVRLAICDMVLPEGVPILLDDALVTFDDERMAAALDYLMELSQKRQILLFTCQHRELRYLTSAHAGRFHEVVPDQTNHTII